MRALAVFVAFLTAVPASAQEPWVGGQFMPRADAKLKVGARDVPASVVPVPYTIGETNGQWLWVGRAWVKKSDVVPIDRAAAYYSGYLRNNPGSVWAHNCRGFVLARQGDLDGALRDYGQAIRLAPEDAAAHVNRGNIWRAKGRLDNALQDYSEAIRLDPRHAGAHVNRGLVRHAQGRLGDALRDFGEAIRLDPQLAAAYDMRAWIRATSAEPEHRDGQQAVKDAAKACELTRWEDGGPLATLAAALAENGDYERAVERLEQAIELNPDTRAAVWKDMLKAFRGGQPYRAD